MNNKAEAKIKEVILPGLENGRPNWDTPHTLGVVHYIKNIITNNPQLNLDEEVLTIAAYAHDWGYSDLFEKGKPATFDDVISQKALHMEIGARKIKQFLNDPIFNYLSQKQKDRIEFLVSKHDKLKELTDTDQLILMEADTLGALDKNFGEPTFDKKSNAKYLQKVQELRFSQFVTDYGKAKYAELFQQMIDYYKDKN